MFKWLGGIGDSNEKEIKRQQPLVNRINELEPEFEKLNDADLRAKTEEFRAQIAEATANIRERLAEAQTELEEARQCLPEHLGTREGTKLTGNAPRRSPG